MSTTKSNNRTACSVEIVGTILTLWMESAAIAYVEMIVDVEANGMCEYSLPSKAMN